MKIFNIILSGIMALLTLLSLFIIICAFNPELTAAVSDFLYSRLEEDGNGETGGLLAETGSELTDKVNGNSPSADGGAVPQNLAADALAETAALPPTDYTPPEKDAIRTPAEVSGRSGYERVKAETEEVDEAAAEEIKEQAGYGETGDGLEFDPDFYPYYQMLEENLQKLYRQIYANAMALNDTFAPIEPVTLAELRNVFSAVFNDHPAIFWLESAYGGRVSRSGTMVEIKLYFNRTADDLAASQALFAGAAEEILAGGRNLGSNYEKEMYVHNALLDRVRYNLSAPLNQNAYSALVNGQTVCAGYARAFQYLMQQLGVPCYYCTGYAGEDHAWNIIRLDGDYYNVDTTWDDTDPNTLDFFNKTDKDFAGTHMREELSVYLPACNGTAYGNVGNSTGTDNGGGQIAAGTVGGGQPSGGQIGNGIADGGQIAAEQADTGGYKRSLAETGFSPQDVLASLTDYYADCYRQIMQVGGSTQFQNVISDSNLLIACSDAYDNDAYAEGYANRVMEELDVESFEVLAIVEELADGSFMLHHTVEIY